MIARPKCTFYDPLQKRGEFHWPREQRKLAAILAADVVDYNGLMGCDERRAGTLASMVEWSGASTARRRFRG